MSVNSSRRSSFGCSSFFFNILKKDRNLSSIRNDLDRLLEAYKGVAPDLHTEFLKPATASEINNVEKEWKVRLPLAYKDFLKLHNGTKDFLWNNDLPKEQAEQLHGLFRGWYFYDTEVIIALYKSMLDLQSDFEERNDKVKPDHGIKKIWFDMKWVPITHNGYGDLICIDMDPAPGGKVGQIIEFWHDDGQRRLLAPSFEEWFTSEVDRSIRLLDEAQKKAEHEKNNPSQSKKKGWWHW